MADPSREDAAADARPTVVAVRLRRGAALVDDHGVTLDAAFRVVVADVEGAVLGDVVAQMNHGLGGAVVVARPALNSTSCQAIINGGAGRSPSNEVRSVRGRRGRVWDGLPVLLVGVGL